MKVLIVGGYGTFGGRLVDLLLGESRLTIFVAGRNLTAARARSAPNGKAPPLWFRLSLIDPTAARC